MVDVGARGADLALDHVEKTVPVRREEVRVEHDPPPEGRIVREEEL